MKETHSMSLNGISLDKYGELLANLVDKGRTIINTQFLWHNESTTKGGAVIVYQTEVNNPDTTGLAQLFGKQENEEDNIKQTTLPPPIIAKREETMLVLEKPENCLVG